MPRLFARELARGNHTMQMATVGLSGATDTLQSLVALGDARRLAPITRALALFSRPADAPPLSAPRRWLLHPGLMRGIGRLTRTAWAKTYAAERLRAHSLIVRAHETRRGETTAALHQAYRLLADAHSPKAIRVAEARSRTLPERGSPRPRETKPRVLVVGEIYVALAPPSPTAAP